MQAWWQRWRWALLAAAVTLGACAALLNHPAAFRLLGLRELQPLFADLIAVLAAGEAAQLGVDVYRGNPLDPFNRPHVYGPAWLLTGELGLTRADGWWLGTMLALAFVGAAVALCAPRSPRATFLTVAALLSPPFILGLERGNNDLVIFLLAAAAAVLLGRGGRLGFAGATLALVGAAALKFYPLVCLVALAAHRDSPRRAGGWALAGALGFGAVWLAQRADIARVLALAPEPATIFAYGIRLAGFVWHHLPAERPWLLAGALPALAAGLLWLHRSRAALFATLPERGTLAAAAVAGAAGWLLCYAWTTNFPYRAMLLLLVFPVLLRPEAPRAAWHLAGLALAGFWFIAPLDWCATAVDADATRTTLLHVLVALTGVQQALMLVVSLAAALLLAGWAARIGPALLRRESAG